jgi:hypothetical protein
METETHAGGVAGGKGYLANTGSNLGKLYFQGSFSRLTGLLPSHGLTPLHTEGP